MLETSVWVGGWLSDDKICMQKKVKTPKYEYIRFAPNGCKYVNCILAEGSYV